MRLADDADPKILALTAYWQSRRPAPDRLPGRHHLSPLEIAGLGPGLLRHVWLLDVEREPLRFRLRLIGSALKAAGSPGNPGSYVDEHDGSGDLTARLVRMCEDRQPAHKRGRPTMPHDPDPAVASLENVLLPLATDGSTVDMIVGCTVYHWPENGAAEPIVLR
jgi:hypothetical protein